MLGVCRTEVAQLGQTNPAPAPASALAAGAKYLFMKIKMKTDKSQKYQRNGKHK